MPTVRGSVQVLRDLGDVVAGCAVVVPGHGRVTDAPGARRRIAADQHYLIELAAGGEPDDDRLADPRVQADHAEQVRRLAH